MKNKTIYICAFSGIIIALSFGFYFGIYIPKKEARIAAQQKQEQELKEQQRQKQEQEAIESEKEKAQALLDSTEEVTLSDADLKSYYAIYKDPFVIHIRKALNGYLAGTNIGIDSPEVAIEKNMIGDAPSGLASFDKSYYMSKFVVFAIDDGIAGGRVINIMFQDKPDRIFLAWVYRYGDTDRYDLRGFWENTEDTQDINLTLKAYRKYISDKGHSL